MQGLNIVAQLQITQNRYLKNVSEGKKMFPKPLYASGNADKNSVVDSFILLRLSL